MRRLIDWFRGRRETPAPALRNRAGGMAWIRGLDNFNGGHTLNGTAVRCVRVVDGCRWVIDPPQRFLAAMDAFYADAGIVRRGAPMVCLAVSDEFLEPWKEDGIREEEVRALYAPGPAVRITAPTSTASMRGH